MLTDWITKLMNCSECGKKRTWLNSRYYPTTCLEGIRKIIKKTASQDSQCSGQYQKNIIPKYESEASEHERACSE
jgi:hypothetical protein